MGKLFGTDGIRGIANRELTPELLLKIGRASALVLNKNNSRDRILIGRDPRLSGDLLEAALIAGITSVGVDVLKVGIVPTPAVAYLTKKLGCSGGLMISASHNPLRDNGIKLFDGAGFKLSDRCEDRIEKLAFKRKFPQPTAAGVGRVFSKPQAVQLYQNYLKTEVPLNLEGLRIALDCAHGSTSPYAPGLFEEMGAQVSPFFHEPNGFNINEECGSTFPEKIQDLTRKVGAQVGFAFDGDGDRVIAVDEKGDLVDGDHILAIIGLHLLHNDKLPARKIIATPYSNGGLREAFLASGGDVILAPVGDRYVLQAMLEEGCVLGGEQSGHIVFLNNATTGDGLLTALKLLEVLTIKKEPLSKLAQSMATFPQRLINIPVRSGEDWLNNSRIQNSIAVAEKRMGSRGRLFIRPSGTEPILRILGEHPDGKVLEEALGLVVEAIRLEQERTTYAN
ncbi:MAG: phosphoglucosamine mutase [Firmicutes bacterium]|nr:phosphoglucosamine mutase [Bacillota bacterium]